MFDESFEGLSANDPEVATAQMTAKMKEFLLDDGGFDYLTPETLVAEQVEEVVMESTAQYWRPVWATLEQRLRPKRLQEGAGAMSGQLHRHAILWDASRTRPALGGAGGKLIVLRHPQFIGEKTRNSTGFNGVSALHIFD